MGFYRPTHQRYTVSGAIGLVFTVFSAFPESIKKNWLKNIIPFILNTWWFWAILAIMSFLWGWWYWVARFLRRLVRLKYESAYDALCFLVKDSRLKNIRTQDELNSAKLFDGIAGPRFAWNEECDKLMQAAFDDAVVIRGRCSATGVIQRIPKTKFKDFTLAFRLVDGEWGGVLCEMSCANRTFLPGFADGDECTDVEVDIVSLKAKFSYWGITRLMYQTLDARTESGRE